MPHSAALLEAIHENEDFRIAADGTWYHGGKPIERQALVRLFSTVLMCDEAGAYWLKTPAEQCEVEVEDAPFTAIALNVQEEVPRTLFFQTNMHEWVALDAPEKLHLRKNLRGETVPYLFLRSGLEVGLTRPVYYELMELALKEGTVQHGKRGITSNGIFFALEA